MSLALASSSACVIRRAALPSAMAASVTAVVVGASLTGVMSSEAVPATDWASGVPLVLPLSVMVKLKLTAPSSLAAGV